MFTHTRITLHARCLVRSVVKLLLVAVIVPALQGCGTLYEMDIWARNTSQGGTQGTYVLAPGNVDISINSADFNKYTAQVERVLAHRDLQRLPYDQLAAADMIILMDYSVSEPILTAYTQTHPMFQSRGQGEMDANAVGPGEGEGEGTPAQPSTPDKLPDHDFAGKQTYGFPRTNYSRRLSLRASTFAWDGQDFDSISRTGNLWTVSVQTVGSSQDLDEVLPVMIAAADPYVTTHQEEMIKTKMNGADKRIKAVSEGL